MLHFETIHQIQQMSYCIEIKAHAIDKPQQVYIIP